ncbi:MAG: hypothetical protein IT507_15945 [Burkholderiaceae bacterium]|nr:hypothetical protein [Burkholderiaceae bacterium]
MKNTSQKKQSSVPVLSSADVFASIQAVARGEAKLPDWAGEKVYVGDAARKHWERMETQSESLNSFSKLLSDNRDVLAAIASARPESVAALARLVHRDESNISRTLGKFEKFGIVALIAAEKGRTKRPVLTMEKLRLDLDLLSGQVQFAAMRSSAAIR